MCKNCEQTDAGAAVGIVAGINPYVAEQTVGDHLDNRIKATRQQLEELCIKRAKAEASGLDKFPHETVVSMILY